MSKFSKGSETLTLVINKQNYSGLPVYLPRAYPRQKLNYKLHNSARSRFEPLVEKLSPVNALENLPFSSPQLHSAFQGDDDDAVSLVKMRYYHKRAGKFYRSVSANFKFI